jgi:hypothetical protein
MALDYAEVVEACRALLSTLEVCTTGSTTLEQTATGYSRASGSFVTDGFRIGMEVTPTGFTDTTKRTISAVAALTMTVGSGLTAEVSGSGRTLAVGQPQTLIPPNLQFKPGAVAGMPYLIDQLLPGPVNVIGVGPGATMMHEPIYLVQWFGLDNKADTDISKCVTAVLEHFAPGTAMTMDDGTVLRVKSRPAPFASSITNPLPGRALSTITIPLWAQTQNV